MVKKILLNNQPRHFSKRDLPLLIHGVEGSGASLFSITLVADLCAQGAKVLFISGYHMARDQFLQQTAISDYIIVEQKSDTKLASRKRVIFLTRDKYEFFVELIGNLPDLADRVVFIKNLELFDSKVLNLTKDLSSLVLAGDIDKSSYAPAILDQTWTTRILFSKSKALSEVEVPVLPKYGGYLKTDGNEGLVSID